MLQGAFRDVPAASAAQALYGRHSPHVVELYQGLLANVLQFFPKGTLIPAGSDYKFNLASELRQSLYYLGRPPAGSGRSPSIVYTELTSTCFVPKNGYPEDLRLRISRMAGGRWVDLLFCVGPNHPPYHWLNVRISPEERTCQSSTLPESLANPDVLMIGEQIALLLKKSRSTLSVGVEANVQRMRNSMVPFTGTVLTSALRPQN